jgi:lipoprotein-releasing system permease protein
VIAWLASKMLFSGGRKILSTTGWISLAGLVLGVASLVVSMAVISGFESTLKKSVTDVAGHIQIFKLNPDTESWQELFDKIKKSEPSVQAASRFALVEGVLAHKGKLSGIFIQGLDQMQIEKVLGLKDRVRSGEFKLNAEAGPDGIPNALIGKGIAKDFGLKPGDEFRLVVPVNANSDVTQFQRRMGKFRVAGVLDLGKFEYDQRWIFASLSAVQNLADIGDRYSGILLKLDDLNKARDVSIPLAKNLGSDYRVRDWNDINQNLFEAVRIEKIVIFFVIFIIVIAAAFNVASSLYVSVVRSYPAIGILKSLGLSKKKTAQLFSVQGVFLGVIGSVLGVLLGLIFCYGFTFIENQFGVIPGSVYKIDRIDVQIRWTDLLAVLSTTILICYLATWAPATKAAKLTALEGLRQE